MLKVASLFCGCGGSDLGLLGGFNFLGNHYPRLGFDIVYAVDFDKYAVETYNANFLHMTKLRDKLSACDDFEIVTVRGLGYKAVLK